MSICRSANSNAMFLHRIGTLKTFMFSLSDHLNDSIPKRYYGILPNDAKYKLIFGCGHRDSVNNID